MQTFRQAMSSIHVTPPFPAFSGGFHSAPRGMIELLHACNPTGIDHAYVVAEATYENQNWTEECQGVVYDSGYWYFSTNGSHGRRGIYQFDVSMNPTGFSLNMNGYGDHLGAITIHRGVIYAPYEPNFAVVWLDTSLHILGNDTLKGAQGGPPPQQDFAWCAMNPWNGWLYSSNFHDGSQVFAYDPAKSFRHVATLRLEIATQSIQGGCFSPTGHLYLASDLSNDIRAFTALNGAYLGSAPIQVDHSILVGEEVEGLCYAPLVINNVFTPLHVIVLDNDLSDDDVIFKHYAMPFA